MGQLKQANNTIAWALAIVLFVLGWVVPFGNAAELSTIRRRAINEQQAEAEAQGIGATVVAPQASNDYDELERLLSGLQTQDGVPYRMVRPDDNIADGESRTSRSLKEDSNDSAFYVLCYGDQITAGRIDDASEEVPYARRLKQSLKAYGLENIKITYKGFVGWTAAVMETYTSSPNWGLIGSIRKHIDDYDRPPHIVVLNAGYNDMWHVDNPGEILVHLKAMTQDALDMGVEKVLLLDLQPSVLRVRNKQKDTWARLVNRLKSQYAQENSNVVSVVFPFAYETKNRALFSDDLLNLSAEGHKKLGDALAPIIHTNLAFGGHVFCYGDSLTAGVSEPGNGQLTPYAPYLEEALTGTYPTFKMVGNVVDNMGLPGWTTKKMLESLDDQRFGLNRWIELSPQDIDVLIIMTGTNDLSTTSTAEEIADIITLHEVALGSPKVRYTLAIDIPPSGDRLASPAKNEKARSVNKLVSDWVRLQPRVQRLFFPFVYEANGANWASDNLHFSVAGYKTLGQELAPIVRDLYKQKKGEIKA
mmetsp:Transcript_49215/g.73367  ORF Transcript_49215/g.73367 Transcript_49215/m.73367 type:complete len:532 (-) Transcript_49215:193-1788(-)|eukprot:CAMPEP_0194043398 /NCGR_PEP_ID=MMETSP0009_2-20130614/15038_1 /TAXON_ID=210454 /ORGANISM="Grammatophora oceanica, Strain CCMP 410" /LENGTH=531 /DNA_ID=CAMNT_0038687591 /DNA_START=232 /DNA_END=1827 /DNA_ORIENTATION=+